MAAKNVYTIRMELTPQQAKYLAGDEGGAKEVEYLQGFAQTAVQKLADGGFLISATPRQRIEQIIGKPIMKADDIVKAVEEAADLEGDNVVVSATLDPIWAGELQEKAKTCGMPLDALVSDLFSQVINMGLLYDMETERVPIFLTPDQHAAIKAHFGVLDKKPLSGDTLVRCLRLKGMEAAQAEG